MLLPDSLKDKTFDTYRPTNETQEKARDIGMLAAKEPRLVPGIYYHGLFGTGKTHIQAAIYNALDLDDKKKLRISPMDVDIGKETIYNAFFVRDDKYKDLFCSAEAIFFDEFTLSGIPPTIIDAIKDFLIYAYDTKKRLFISSNHPIKEVTQRFINESLVVSKNMSGEVVDKRQMEKLVAERLESRLNEMLVEYEITGNDYRNTLADQRKKDIEERLKK